LRHEELGGAYAKTIADPDLRLEQAFGREVLAERSPRQVVVRKLSPPVLVVLAGIDIDSLLLAPMHGEVGLLVAFQVERGDAYGPFDRALPYRRPDRAPVPFDLPGKADVYRDQLTALHQRTVGGIMALT
jgi:hypothetical protein